MERSDSGPSSFVSRSQPGGGKRLAAITAQDSQRQSPYEVRAEAQRARFNLPAWPTTTIGSFPQTTEIRGLRPTSKGQP